MVEHVDVCKYSERIITAFVIHGVRQRQTENSNSVQKRSLTVQKNKASKEEPV
jgi:hypothetical protein